MLPWLISVEGCCGIKELDGVEGCATDTCLKSCVVQYIDEFDSPAHIFFSTTSRKKRKGAALAALIKKKKLGTIVETIPAVNGSTGNSLTMWVWTPNKRAIRNYYNNIRH